MTAVPGKVYLVGAGPGAPDLLTLRAARLLERADIVFHDALVHPGTVALASKAEHVAVGKRCGRHSTGQRFINKRLVDAAYKHRCVIRLKGGDPMLFGRAREEIAALEAAGIDYEVVPGVTAALAASAELGVSLTERGISRSVAFVTPRTASGARANDWARAAAAADTAVIYMGAGEAALVAAELTARGLSAATPVAVVENASLPQAQQFRLTLAELPSVSTWGLAGPSLLVVGEVCANAVRATADAPARVRSA